MRATVRGNLAHTAMLSQSGGVTRIESSVFDDNEVLPWPTSTAGTSLVGAYNGGQIRIEHATVLSDTPLDRFFYLHGSSTVAARAGIFASSASPAPTNVGGTAPPSQFAREWCGFFQDTSDFAAHTVVPDPGSGTFVTIAPAGFELDPVTHAPGDALVDRCTPSVETDYHGNAFGSGVYYPGDPPADIGAVENRDDVIFADGFEP